MPRVKQASCTAGIVTVDGFPVPVAKVLSEGIGASQGVALIEGEEVTYVTSSAEDVKQVIEKVSELITKVTTILTALDGVTVAPGTSAAAIADLEATNLQFVVLKELLK